jgi:two-component system cell cycle sensor histidine kinase/response regulator CckA
LSEWALFRRALAIPPLSIFLVPNELSCLAWNGFRNYSCLSMRLSLPLLRTRYIPPARAPVLRYGVAVLSTTLALIPALMLSDVVESRLVVFAVAVMVSAWYGGWKPGLVATSFALTVSAYFSLGAGRSSTQYRNAIIQLLLFVLVAVLICWFNAALRSAQEGLRRSEVNFRSLVTNAPYGICRCDAEGTLLSANPTLVSTLGYTSASDLIGTNLASFYVDAQQWFTAADHFRSSRRFNNLIAEWHRKDGRTITLRLSGRTILEEGAIYFELFAEDVTEHRALEQQLRQAQKMEAVGRLAGGIAHDFNNLLMVISGYCEFLMERIGPDPAIREPAQEIAKAANRATALTRQLLAFSRKQMLAPKVMDLNAVVNENLKMLTRVIGEDIELVMVPGDLGLVKADPGQIEQVILNLAVNARDAMPHGGKLTIETTNVNLDETYARTHAPAQAGDYVMLSISDTGTGMDAETLNHIFEPFYTTKGVKGTGLGLSTVYGIVKQSGGYIWVFSEPDQGTSFKVYLPRVNAMGEVMTVQPPLASLEGARGRESVLLVEDEETVRELTRQYLLTQGYEVLEAAGPAAALKISRVHPGPIHLLLTDVIMPGMNGPELALRVTAERPETRVLYMSGYTENAIGHNGTLDPGITLLQKPFTLQTLTAKVREVLDAPLVQEVAMSGSSDQPVSAKGKIAPFRAQRFLLQLPLKYRKLGEHDWREGTTENISRSGMLFRGEEALSPKVQLEISLVLPAEIAGLTAAEVVCRGEVVRTVESATPSVSPALAAKILQYHFQHGQIGAA